MSDQSNAWVPGHVVVVSRDIPGAHDITGVFVAASTEWVVLEQEYECFLNGFVAIRREDVDLVVDVTDAFKGQALRALGIHPSDPGPLDLRDTASLVESLRTRYPVLIFSTEYDEADVCWVGHVRRCGDGRMWLREISPQARWDDEDTEWTLDEISMVEFATRYARAIHAVGGAPPATA